MAVRRSTVFDSLSRAGIWKGSVVDGQNCVFVTLLRCGIELTMLAILVGTTWMSYFPPLGRALMTRYGVFLRTEAPVLQWRGPQSFKRLGK